MLQMRIGDTGDETPKVTERVSGGSWLGVQGVWLQSPDFPWTYREEREGLTGSLSAGSSSGSNVVII